MKVHIDPAASLRVHCDGNRLRQILVNLIGNAIKFTTTGTMTVNLIRAHRDDRPLLVHFAVGSTGIGIPEDRPNRLFSPSTQVDSSTSRKFGGTGLGLALCKQLVELMDGTIGIESQLGIGSAFWFEVPLPVIGQCSQSPESWRHLANAHQRVLNERVASLGLATAEASPT